MSKKCDEWEDFYQVYPLRTQWLLLEVLL
jgi:hypothetical protein